MDLRQHLEEELEKDFQLLKQYENEKRNENDPGLRNKWETKIQSIKQDIKKRQEELNQLMKEKNKNDINAKSAFDERVKEAKKEAIKDNIEKAEKSGNVLTQTVDKDGNLIGINNNTQIEHLKNSNQEISSADICKELFEGENIVMGKTDNGQSKLVSGPFATKK